MTRLTPDRIAEIKRRWALGESAQQIGRMVGCKADTVFFHALQATWLSGQRSPESRPIHAGRLRTSRRRLTCISQKACQRMRLLRKWVRLHPAYDYRSGLSQRLEEGELFKVHAESVRVPKPPKPPKEKNGYASARGRRL